MGAGGGGGGGEGDRAPRRLMRMQSPRSRPRAILRPVCSGAALPGDGCAATVLDQNPTTLKPCSAGRKKHGVIKPKYGLDGMELL
jgi:hypothetical protein